MIIIFNIAGMVMMLISFGIAYGVCHMLGNTAEGFWMVISGLVAMVLDFTYRFMKAVPRYFHPKGGGSVFFLPVWLFGVIWLVLGVVYTIRGHA
jgi:hypothetical protein